MSGGNDNLYIDRPDLGQEKQEKWNALKRNIPVLISVLVGLGTGIGNLICFEFSESSLGRLLQALELYILVLYVLISTFYQSRSKADQLSIEDDRLPIVGSKERITTIDERTPASRSSFNVQPGTGSLLPTSMPSLTKTSLRPRRSARLSSWLTSINTSRDSDVNNASMSSTPGSSILSPSSSNQKASGRVSSLLYYYAERARSLKSRSGLLSGVGGRIRSVSWDMFNPAFGEEKVGKGDENEMPIESLNEKRNQRRESHPSQLQATTPNFQTPKIPTPTLASRLERLAMQLDFMPSSSLTSKNGQTTGETMDTLSPGPTDRLSIPMSNPNEFRLTPITHNALQLDTLSYYYEPDANSNHLNRATYSLWHSDSYTKSVRSSASSSIAGFETFLSQQQAELNMSVAELGLFESGLLNNGEGGGDLVGGSQKNSLASDFSFSRFPEPPAALALGRDAETGESAFVELEVGTEGQGNYPGASTTLPETIGPVYSNSESLRSPSSFPAPIKRTSGDSSVLGMNEGALTLGLGLNGIVTREELGTSSQFDVTSFIATGGGRTDSFQSHIRSPHLEIERYRPSSSDVEEADGGDDGTMTPTRSVVRFATVVRVPPVVSAPAKQRIPSRFSFRSQKEDAPNAKVKIDSILNTSEVAPVPTTILATTAGLVARPGQTSVSSIRQTHRKKIGLPSRVKLDVGDSSPPFAH
ncbi:hypothetical protein Clacol_007516 [Clathrus columnatus]|uniref:Uncharacterized protein n=1 Tax=Clathrus columnatus TaxID=1419009 RepID=A0AAV5AK66_9AGAM|nr:hypothetical protein Clacol_007516 [Clathrus columnatus]